MKTVSVTRNMNQTTLVLAAVLAATALIIGTAGILQPAAAYHHKSHIKANNIEANQDIKQNVACSTPGSSPGSTPQAGPPDSTPQASLPVSTPGNCNNNYQQAANIAVFSHSSQEN
jgi:hypothetical protein